MKSRVVCGTVYGDMHLKDLLGSFVRVEYHIPVPDFYLVLHGLCCRKSIIIRIKPNHHLYFVCLCFTSLQQRGHLETAPPFTVPCKGCEAR